MSETVYIVRQRPGVSRLFRKMTDRRLAKRLADAITALGTNPRPPGSEKLSGKHRDMYRVRVGNYRIVYIIEDAILRVVVVEVGNRREIYDRL